MTPTERALLHAIGDHLHRMSHDMHLRQMVQEMATEDDRRATADRMPQISREAYNERLSRG